MDSTNRYDNYKRPGPEPKPIDGEYPKLGVYMRQLLGWNGEGQYYSARDAQTVVRKPSYNTILNMAAGRRPSAESIKQFASKFPGADYDKLMVLSGYADENDALKLKITNEEPPENHEDWPLPLQEAMHFSDEIDYETKKYIYNLYNTLKGVLPSIENIHVGGSTSLTEKPKKKNVK